MTNQYRAVLNARNLVMEKMLAGKRDLRHVWQVGHNNSNCTSRGGSRGVRWVWRTSPQPDAPRKQLYEM